MTGNIVGAPTYAAIVRHHFSNHLIFMDSSHMDRNAAAPRPYSAPRLKVYGTVAELTLTSDNPRNKNDPTQGQNNLKT